MKTMTRAGFAALMAGCATDLLAHAGHGATAPLTLAHYLVEPLHVMTAFAPLALLAATVWVLRRRAPGK